MMAMEARASRLEGPYEHLATKADLAELKGELMAAMGQMEVRLVRWTIGIIVAAATLTGTIAFAAASLTN